MAGLPEDGSETALAVPEDSAMEQVSATAYDANPTFSQTDLWVSKLRLAQGQTPEVLASEARAGEWVLTGMPAAKNVTAIPLGFNKPTRRYGIVNGQRYIACNKHVGDVDVDCPNCRIQWDETLSKNPGFQSEAEEYYSYMVYVVEADSPALLELSRTGMAAGRIINTFIFTKGGMAKFGLKLGSKVIEGKKGRYFQATVEMAQVPAEQLERASRFMPS